MQINTKQIIKVRIKLISLLAEIFVPIEQLKLHRVNKYKTKDTIPVFIVSVPRSGATLLYQIITNYFNVSYISNLAAGFYKALTIGMDLHYKLFNSKQHNSFESYGGYNKKWIAPHEAGKFWYRWFPKDPQYVTKKMIETKNFDELKKTVAYIEEKFQKPIVLKNTVNSLRLNAIRDIFPSALIIYITRKPSDVGISILKHRIKDNGDKTKWWAIEPPMTKELKKLPFYEQIAQQIHQTEQIIEHDMGLFPSKQTLKVNYEDLCQNLELELKKIESLFHENGITVKYKKDAKLPELKLKSNVQPNNKDEEMVIEAINQLQW